MGFDAAPPSPGSGARAFGEAGFPPLNRAPFGEPGPSAAASTVRTRDAIVRSRSSFGSNHRLLLMISPLPVINRDEVFDVIAGTSRVLP